MPLATPAIKVASVRHFGAKVILHGDSFQDAAVEAQRLCELQNCVLIHPYDDPHVIAGQGTIGMEV